ncbi:MAG: nickel pincer cofactor biosynthesis protein LarB [Candidatus Edwardsbacteria bacterium]|nr:nickel pincer cofactor biosynthesis protein LarB [Candidatus Edwardsbacteria bacterium]
MDQDKIRKIIREIRSGKLGEAEALRILRHLPYRDLGFANIDHHRALRRGAPEVIFCQGKTPQQVAKIFKSMRPHGLAMATRADRSHWRAVKKAFPRTRYFETARIIANTTVKPVDAKRYIAVLTAGTSDIPVADEAAVTAELLGCRAERMWDVGVAGIHRLFDKLPILQNASVIVAAAGMEGALPSVVSGLVRCPVIAVPTSVGYGASFGGITALLAMLNSCSPGVAVVNIDNGIGAGATAALVANRAARQRQHANKLAEAPFAANGHVGPRER